MCGAPYCMFRGTPTLLIQDAAFRIPVIRVSYPTITHPAVMRLALAGHISAKNHWFYVANLCISPTLALPPQSTGNGCNKTDASRIHGIGSVPFQQRVHHEPDSTEIDEDEQFIGCAAVLGACGRLSGVVTWSKSPFHRHHQQNDSST